MAEEAIKLGGKKKSKFIDQVKAILPEGGNLNLCLTCGACSSGCPATGLEDMDPRKFLRMAALGMDDEILSSEWAWCCTLCMRCIYVCPMKIDIPQLVFNVRKSRPREQRPKGILGSCDMALRNDTCSAMGATEEDFQFVVEDVLEEVRQTQEGFENLQAGRLLFFKSELPRTGDRTRRNGAFVENSAPGRCGLDLRYQGMGC
jgi:ferredoxin